MAKSRNIGSIYAELTLKDQMTKGLSKAQASLSKFAATSAKWAGAGLAASVTATSAALVAGSKHTLSMTDDLADMSAQTGIAISDMMLLQQAYKDGGREAEAVGKDIGKMQKSLVAASQGGSDPFSSIGLSVSELMAMNPAKQFETIGAAILRIQNPAERTAKAMEIFGKGGMGLMTVFGGMENAEKALGRMPELAERFGAAMGEANDLIGHLPVKSDQFFMGFTAGIIGELLPGLQKIDDYDFTTLGESLGKALATGFQMITDGTLFELMELKFYKVFTGIEAALEDIFGEVSQKTVDNMDDIEGAIVRLNEKIAAKFQANSDAAAALGVKSPITNPIDTTAAPATWTPPAAAPVSGNGYGFVDDYMKRGLSLNTAGGGSESKLQNVVDVLREIAAGLGRIDDKFAPGTW